MSSRKPNIDELIQKIDQLLNILNMIAGDLREISITLKTAGAPTAPVAITAPPQPVTERAPKIEDIRMMFPKDLENMLLFEDKGDFILIKPRQYLGSENFAKIASIIRGAGGEYISAGKESHFRVPKEPR